MGKQELSIKNVLIVEKIFIIVIIVLFVQENVQIILNEESR
jgi:hypothetical protein